MCRIKKKISILLTIALSMSFSNILTKNIYAQSKVQTEVEILHQGKSGDLNWNINSEGLLTITGIGNYEQIDIDENYLSNVPKWCQYKQEIYSAQVQVSGIESTARMFSECSELKHIDLTGLDTSNVTDMSGMFSGCEMLTELDLSHFNTENVTNMSAMFKGCSELQELDLSCFNTSQVTNMSDMFSYKNDEVCMGLENINISSFDTENVTDMSGMFQGCVLIENLDLNHFSTHNVKEMDYMFCDCYHLKNLNIENFRTDKVVGMEAMFAYCQSLQKIDLSSFNTENVTDMNCMFEGCYELVNLDLSNFNLKGITYKFELGLNRCKSLIQIQTPINNSICEILPEGTWIDSQGNIYTELPQFLDYSIELRNKEVIDFPTETIEEHDDVTREEVSSDKQTTKADSKEKYQINNASKDNEKVRKPNRTEIKKLSAKKKSLKITWKKISDISGYEIQYATSAKFEKAKKVVVSSGKTTSKTIKKLKKKKKYYVRIRTYKIVGGKKYYSLWSKKKNKRTK